MYHRNSYNVVIYTSNMELGVKIGKSKVGYRGQSSLAITIPQQVVENFNIEKGDIIEFYQNGELIILKVVKNVHSRK